MSILGDVMDWCIDTASSFLSGGSSSGSSERDYDRSHTSSSSSSTVTHYRPDDIEIEKLQNERIHLAKEAQLEVMEKKARLEAVMLEARCKGYHAMQQAMLEMLKEVDALAQQRQALLENGSFEQIRKVEAMYADMEKEVKNDDFMLNKVPQLYALLQQYPEGSDIRQSFLGNINQEIILQMNFKAEQVKGLRERCKAVTDSVLASKERMQVHIDTVIVKGIEHMEQALQQNNPQLDFNGTNSQLNAPKQSSASEPFKIEHLEK